VGHGAFYYFPGVLPIIFAGCRGGGAGWLRAAGRCREARDVRGRNAAPTGEAQHGGPSFCGGGRRSRQERRPHGGGTAQRPLLWRRGWRKGLAAEGCAYMEPHIGVSVGAAFLPRMTPPTCYKRLRDREVAPTGEVKRNPTPFPCHVMSASSLKKRGDFRPPRIHQRRQPV
jgi:hypothetical protein